MTKNNQKRRMFKRPMKSAAFRFDERLYLQFQTKATENDMSCVEALEHLMKLAVGGLLDLSAFEPTQEEAVLEEASSTQKMAMLMKFHMLLGSEKFVPDKRRIDNCIALKKPVIIRHPKFRVSIRKSKSGEVSIEIIENNKIKAVIDGEPAEQAFSMLCMRAALLVPMRSISSEKDDSI